MSQEELVSAYIEGEISRRTLIRRLVAAGVGIGAATSYAQLLTPKARAASAPERGITAEYPETIVRIVTKRVRPVIRNKKIKVRVRTLEGGPSTFHTRVKIYQRQQLLGELELDFEEAGTKTVVVPLDTVKPLRRRRKVGVKAIVFEDSVTGPRIELARHARPLVRRKRRGKKKA